MNKLLRLASREGPADRDRAVCAEGLSTWKTTIEDSTQRVRNSLDSVLGLLDPLLRQDSHDEAMIELALDRSHFEEPLSRHEVIVLATALYMDRIGRNFDYNDVLEMTERFSGRAMNVTMVYKTFNALLHRGLIEERGRERDEKTERSSRVFGVTDDGCMAFRLAIVNARHLNRSRGLRVA